MANGELLATKPPFDIATMSVPGALGYHVIDTEPGKAYRVDVSITGAVGSQLAPFVMASAGEIDRCNVGWFMRWHDAGAVVQYPAFTRIYINVSGYTAGTLNVTWASEHVTSCYVSKRQTLQHTQLIPVSAAPVPVTFPPCAEYAISSSPVTVAGVVIPAWDQIPIVNGVGATLGAGLAAIVISYTRMP